MQVALTAGSGPAFVHVVVTVVGVPIVPVAVVGAEACISACITDTCTQSGSFAGHEITGVHGLAEQPFGNGGVVQVAPVQLLGSVMLFATDCVPSGIELAALNVTFTLATPGVAPTSAGTLVKLTGHTVPAASPPVQLLVAVVVPLATETKVVFAGTTSLIV
jgi:hypothetical protein